MNLATFHPATEMHAITASPLDGFMQHRAEHADLCFWPYPYDHNKVVFDGFVKCDGGVCHLIRRCERVTIH